HSSPTRRSSDLLLEPKIRQAAACGHQENFKSVLQQYAQQNLGETPSYRVLDEKGPDHAKCFKIGVEIGGRRFESKWGQSKKQAEPLAALAALHDLGGVERPDDGVVQGIESMADGERGSGVRGQESGGRGQGAGGRSQESGVRSQESGVRGQESGVRGQRGRGAESAVVVVDQAGVARASSARARRRGGGSIQWGQNADGIGEAMKKLTLDMEEEDIRLA